MYRYTGCTGKQGVQVYRVYGIQGVQVYRVYRNTGCTGIQGVQVYRVYRYIGCTGIQGVQVYRVYRYTGCTGINFTGRPELYLYRCPGPHFTACTVYRVSTVQYTVQTLNNYLYCLRFYVSALLLRLRLRHKHSNHQRCTLRPPR